jgi:acyl carrier protein phosphodiesterase
MNYLAHFHLSNIDEDLIIGNYIADDVNGKGYLKYPLPIQNGIILHRKIDTFTDTHPVVARSKEIIRYHQRKYTPVVIDVFYDYFLATNWQKYANQDFLNFTHDIYKVLFKNRHHLPLKSQGRLPFMATSNWLFNYGKIAGIKKSLTGLSKRSNYPNNMDKAHLLIKEHEKSLQHDFETFYPELITFVTHEIKKIT